MASAAFKYCTFRKQQRRPFPSLLSVSSSMGAILLYTMCRRSSDGCTCTCTLYSTVGRFSFIHFLTEVSRECHTIPFRGEYKFSLQLKCKIQFLSATCEKEKGVAVPYLKEQVLSFQSTVEGSILQFHVERSREVPCNDVQKGVYGSSMWKGVERFLTMMCRREYVLYLPDMWAQKVFFLYLYEQKGSRAFFCNPIPACSPTVQRGEGGGLKFPCLVNNGF